MGTMTEDAHKNWDAMLNEVSDATDAVQHFWGTMPDGPVSASRNRVEMAWRALEQARDFLAAARARMPETETER